MMKDGHKARLSTGADEEASTAIEALAWLAADETRLRRFLDICGLGPQNLRKAAAEPRFLAAILDYLASDEPLLFAFARDSGRTPEAVARAHARLRDADGAARP